jgi:hypothetical protein
LLVGKKDLIGAEIGVYRGQHAREMLELLNIKTLILVDPWKDYKEYKDKPLKEQVEGAYFDAKELLEKWDKVGLIHWIKNFSVEASEEIPDNILDFVYIDGSHQYEFVIKDIEAWFPKVKEGGFIGGHDYIKKFPGVIKAVDEFCEKNGIKFETRDGNKFPYYKDNADWAFIKGENRVILKWEFTSEDVIKTPSGGGDFKPL